MNKSQLKRLIEAVIREMDSEKPDTTMKHSMAHEKAYGSLRDTTLKFKLGGVNKNNAHIIKDFIAQAAHAAKMADLELIHAELESNGKIGLELDGGDIKKSEEEINAELDAIAADLPDTSDTQPGQMPSKEQWKKMSPEQRDKYIKANSHEKEWQAATEKDMEDTRKKQQLKKAAIAAGTYDPNDTQYWTDKEWDAWNANQDQTQTYDTGKSAGKYKPNLSKKTAQGIKGAVSADFTKNLRH